MLPRQPLDQIMAELTPDRLLRKTNNGNNEVYIFDNNTSPVLMQEVGRVRELTFRHAGGGTGHSIDIDDFDTVKEDPQRQLIVWDPDNREIIGGYRFYFPAERLYRIVTSPGLHHQYILHFRKNSWANISRT